MAIPTITTVLPNTGPVGGYTFAVITGTNFKAPASPAPSGPTVSTSVPVSVTVNGDLAVEILLLSTTEIWILTPPYHGTPVDDPIPAVNVVITNLDGSGNPIAGETVTATGAYTYRRPIIHSTSGNSTALPHPIALVSSSLILGMRRQVFMNVVATTHVDYSEPGVVSLNIAKVPALIIQGPNISKDLDYTHNELDIIDLGSGNNAVKQPPDVLRLGYSFLCVSDNEQELLNIMGSFQIFFMKEKYLHVQINPLDPSQGFANLVMQLTQFPQATTTPSDNNLRVWIATAEIRGVEVHLDETAYQVQDVATINAQVQQLTGNTLEVIAF